jgi:protein translocase SecG subunit
MHLVTKILPYAQIILSVVLVIAILLQQSGAGVGGAMGGGDDSFHHTRRGLEKFLFYLSIVCAILFALSAFLAIIIKAKF